MASKHEIVAGNVSTLVVWRLDCVGPTAKGLVPLLNDLRQWSCVMVQSWIAMPL
jgi:hypothetical protein